MMLIIHGLPRSTKYQDLKQIIKQQCNLNDFILDNLLSEHDGTKKVRIGLMNDAEGSILMKCLDGFRISGHIITVRPVGKTIPANISQQDYQPQPGYQNHPPSNYPNVPSTNYGHAAGADPGRRAPWSGGGNQWVQPGAAQMQHDNYGYQQNQFIQQQPVHQQRPAFHSGSQIAGPQGHMAAPQSSFAHNPGPPDGRSHVLRTVEIVDTEIQHRGYRDAHQFKPQDKPMTIMKDNFKGPTSYMQEGGDSETHYHVQGQVPPWKQPKPQPFNETRKYPEHDKMSLHKPDENARNSRGQMRGFSPKRITLPVGRRDEPSGRRISPNGRRISPGRRASPPGQRNSSPGHRGSPPGRRMSPPGRRFSPSARRLDERRISPGDRRHGRSSPGRLSPRRMDVHKRVSPGRRPSPGRRVEPRDVDRYSPSRRHKDEEYGVMESRPPLSKTAKTTFEPSSQAPKHAMYSGGYRASIHENVQYPIPGMRQVEQRSSAWQQTRDKDSFMQPQENERRGGAFEQQRIMDSAMEPKRTHSPTRKSRSPARRDRSPVRDRYRRHSPSPRSPRRSWALEKRRSPEDCEPPPPPIWPGQKLRDEDEYSKPIHPERINKDEKKRLPVWDKSRYEENVGSQRHDIRPQEDRGPHPVMEDKQIHHHGRRDLSPRHELRQGERISTQKNSKFSSRDNFESEREDNFNREESFRKTFFGKSDTRDPERDRRDGPVFERPDNRQPEFENRINKPLQHLEERRDFRKMFNKEIEDVHKRASEFSKKTEEFRREKKMGGEDHVRRVTELDELRHIDRKRQFEREEEIRQRERMRDERNQQDESERHLRNAERPDRSRYDKFSNQPHREPEWNTEAKPRFRMVLPEVKIKRDKAAEEIAEKILSKQNFKGDYNLEKRVVEELKLALCRIINDMFGDKDVSFIEIVIKFNAKHSEKDLEKIFTDVMSSFPSHARKIPMKRPAIEPSVEIPVKRHSAESPMKLGHASGSIIQPPKSKRPARVRAAPVGTIAKPAKLVVTKTTPAATEKSSDVSKPVNPKSQEPTRENSDGHYELNGLMSRILQNELQNIMIKVWQALPDETPIEAERLVTERFRNEIGDELRNVLGLNVTKRLLDIHSPLIVKIEFTRKPDSKSIKDFITKYNIIGLRRAQGSSYSFMAKLRSINDFDYICNAKNLRCGDVNTSVIPCYKFSQCPVKIKTNFVEPTKATETKSTDNSETDKTKETTNVNDSKDNNLEKSNNQANINAPVKSEVPGISNIKKSTVNIGVLEANVSISSQVQTENKTDVHSKIKPNTTTSNVKKTIDTQKDLANSISNKMLASNSSPIKTETNDTKKLDLKDKNVNVSATVVPKTQPSTTKTVQLIKSETQPIAKTVQSNKKVTETTTNIKVAAKTAPSSGDSNNTNATATPGSVKKSPKNASTTTNKTPMENIVKSRIKPATKLSATTGKVVKASPNKQLRNFKIAKTNKQKKREIDVTIDEIEETIDEGEEMDDAEILALLSGGIVLDECGSDE